MKIRLRLRNSKATITPVWVAANHNSLGELAELQQKYGVKQQTRQGLDAQVNELKGYYFIMIIIYS
jgi:hypothetical protein